MPFGLLLTAGAGLGDIRAIGSGNIGATNVLRTGNKALAAATLVLDALKGAVALLLAALALGRGRGAGGRRRRRARPCLPGLARLPGRQGGGDRRRACCWPRLAGSGSWRCAGLARRGVAARASPRPARWRPARRRRSSRRCSFGDLRPGAVRLGIAALIAWRHQANIRAPAGRHRAAHRPEGVSDRLRRRRPLTRLRAGAQPEGVGAACASPAPRASARHLPPPLERHGSAARRPARAPRAPLRPRIAVPRGRGAARDRGAGRLGGRCLLLGRRRLPAAAGAAGRRAAGARRAGRSRRCSRRAAVGAGRRARNASAAGRRIAEELADGLAAGGHRRRLRPGARHRRRGASRRAAPQGRTVAAVAGGLDEPYPPENADAAGPHRRGGRRGGQPRRRSAPRRMARHFPRRNRIVAGLSLGVVVVEAAPRSGSLITARLGAGGRAGALRGAGQPARPALPRRQRPDPPGRAPDRDRRGRAGAPARQPPATRRCSAAARCRSPSEPPPDEPPRPPADGRGRQVLELLGTTPIAVDDLVRRCHLSASAVRRSCSTGACRAGRTLPGNRVARCRRLSRRARESRPRRTPTA